MNGRIRYHKEEFLVLHDYPKEEVYGNSQVYDKRIGQRSIFKSEISVASLFEERELLHEQAKSIRVNLFERHVKAIS